MTEFEKKSFSVYQQGDSQYRDRWEETFGKKESVSGIVPKVDLSELPSSFHARCAACGLSEVAAHEPCIPSHRSHSWEPDTNGTKKDAERFIQRTNDFLSVAEVPSPDIAISAEKDKEFTGMGRNMLIWMIVDLRRQLAESLTIKGWFCPCGIFNGEEKETLVSCRTCGAPKP